MLKHYPYTLFGVGLLVLLTTPMLLKQQNRLWEPYPAAILPGGGSVVVRDRTTAQPMSSVRAYAIDRSTAEWKQLSVTGLIAPIPGHYFAPLHHRKVFDQLLAPEEHADLRKWFSDRLIHMGYRGDSLLLINVSVYFDPVRRISTPIDTTKVQRIGLR